ncbi:hypothetical protein PGT21_030414 [Puccinia graminis f. sp. tritici]|uniref:Uncharacterized protein n=1 Tax=Puccinia graminis f. sp. tritici TaxID=56615 RepID=A0A5B0MRH1_PUCGR|nr:hypothetical protein PGT21_030414 [Puccinia graminis f. sp. tritici]KAA1078530.1 hypothetical protein PGTUg99_007909 [Puccinia graminis f. sp. tritici]
MVFRSKGRHFRIEYPHSTGLLPRQTEQFGPRGNFPRIDITRLESSQENHRQGPFNLNTQRPSISETDE